MPFPQRDQALSKLNAFLKRLSLRPASQKIARELWKQRFSIQEKAKCNSHKINHKFIKKLMHHVSSIVDERTKREHQNGETVNRNATPKDFTKALLKLKINKDLVTAINDVLFQEHRIAEHANSKKLSTAEKKMVMSALKPTQKQELENIINKQINEEVIIKFIDEVAQASHAKKDSNFMNAKAVHLNDQEWTDIIARVFKSKL